MELVHHLKFNTDMRINTLNRSIILCLQLLVLNFSITFISGCFGNIGKYDLISNREDDQHIKIGDRVVIESTIIDYDSAGSVLYGIRMPTEKLVCDNGGGYKIRVINQRKYFILNVNSGVAQNYSDKEKFLSDLKKYFSKTQNFGTEFDSVWTEFLGRKTLPDSFQHC